MKFGLKDLLLITLLISVVSVFVSMRQDQIKKQEQAQAKLVNACKSIDVFSRLDQFVDELRIIEDDELRTKESAVKTLNNDRLAKQEKLSKEIVRLKEDLILLTQKRVKALKKVSQANNTNSQKATLENQISIIKSQISKARSAFSKCDYQIRKIKIELPALAAKSNAIRKEFERRARKAPEPSL